MVSSELGEQVILASGGYDHMIRFWSPHNGQCLRIVQHPDSQVNAMAITPSKQLLAAAGFQHVRMYDIQSTNPNPLNSYEGVSKNVTGVGFNDESRWMYTSGEDCTVRIWDIRNRSQQAQRNFETMNSANTVTLHPNQTQLYIGDSAGFIYVWDLRAGEQSQPQQQHQIQVNSDVSIQHLDIEAEGNYLAAVDNKGNCYLFSMNASFIAAAAAVATSSSSTTISSYSNKSPFLQKRRKFQAHKRHALKCRFSPDSTLLVTTSSDHTAKIWKTADLLLIKQAENSSDEQNINGWTTVDNLPNFVELKDPNQRWVWDVAFSNDSQYVITGSSDNFARVWGVNDGEVKQEYNGHQKAITALAFADGVSET